MQHYTPTCQNTMRSMPTDLPEPIVMRTVNDSLRHEADAWASLDIAKHERRNDNSQAMAWRQHGCELLLLKTITNSVIFVESNTE